MSNENDSFFQEVEESVRQDQYVALARKYGVFVIAAIALVLAGVGGWRLYQGWETNQARQASESFAAAQKLIEGGNVKGGAAAFEQMSRTAPKIYRLMARMQHAQALEAEGDLTGALAEFDAVAGDASDPIMRDSARMRAAYLVAETQDLAAVQARVTPIIQAGGAMAPMARELLGVKAWEAGRLELARDTLQTLTLAFDAPDSVRQRAQLALTVIGAPAAPAAPAAAPAQSSGAAKQ